MKKNNFSLLIFIISFLIYSITCASNITFEDSSEFITAAFHLGIAHPPGYPLYLLFAKLIFSLTHSIYFVNLLSSFLSSLAIVILYFAGIMILKSELKSFLSMLFFSISTSVWLNSTIAEVYSLNLFLFSIQFFLLVKANKKFKKNIFFLLTFINGVSLTNHQTSIFMSFLIFFMFFYNKWHKNLKAKDYLYSFILFTIGISGYLYLIIRSQYFPIMNWGNPHNLKNFIYVILRKQYGDLSLLNLKNYFSKLHIINPFYEISPIFNIKNSIIIISGLIALFYFNYKKTKKNNFLLMLSIFLFYTFFLLLITNTPQSKLFTVKSFFIPAWTIFYIMLFNIIENKKILFSIIILFPSLLFFNFKYTNKHNYFYTRDYTKNILKNLDYNSIIFTLKDNETFPLWELQYVENFRPDVKIINLVLLSEKWYIKQIKKIYPELQIRYIKIENKSVVRNIEVNEVIKKNKKFPVYFTTKKYKDFLNLDIPLIPSGNVFQYNAEFFTNIIYYTYFRNINNKKFLFYFGKNLIHKYSSKKYLDVPTRYMMQGLSELLYLTGEYLFSKSQFNIALNYYKLSMFYNYLIGLEINNVYNFYKIGKIYLNSGDIEKYRYFSIIATKLQPNTEFSKQLINEINQVKNIYIKKYKEAEQYYKTKNYKKAIEVYKKLIKYNKSLIFSNIGDCYFNLKQIDMAIKYYELAIDNNKNYITPYYNLGGCYYIKQDFKKAGEIWKRGLEINPDNKLLKNALKNIPY